MTSVEIKVRGNWECKSKITTEKPKQINKQSPSPSNQENQQLPNQQVSIIHYPIISGFRTHDSLHSDSK